MAWSPPARQRRSWLVEQAGGYATPRFHHLRDGTPVAKRMNKAQQMRWTKATVQPFLDVRMAVLNSTLEEAFCQRYPGFQPTNDDQALPKAA